MYMRKEWFMSSIMAYIYIILLEHHCIRMRFAVVFWERLACSKGQVRFRLATSRLHTIWTIFQARIYYTFCDIRVRYSLSEYVPFDAILVFLVLFSVLNVPSVVFLQTWFINDCSWFLNLRSFKSVTIKTGLKSFFIKVIFHAVIYL